MADAAPAEVPGPAAPASAVPSDVVHHRTDGDGWVECGCGRRHWGRFGAAGLLVARRDATGAPVAVVLQHRAPWSDQGGTWGVPGGALAGDEPAVAGALREAEEEAGIDPAHVRVLGTTVLRHPDWSYTTVLAEEAVTVEPATTDAESVEVRWVPVDDVPGLPLLAAFRDAWPDLRRRLEDGDESGTGDPTP